MRRSIARWWFSGACETEKIRLLPENNARGAKPVKSFRKAWTTACEAAGCSGAHRARLPAHGGPVKVTGHKTEAVYRRYAIVSSGDLAEAAQKLQAMAPGTISGTIVRPDEDPNQQKANA